MVRKKMTSFHCTGGQKWQYPDYPPCCPPPDPECKFNAEDDSYRSWKRCQFYQDKGESACKSWFACVTCGMLEPCICQTCSEKCHVGHDIVPFGDIVSHCNSLYFVPFDDRFKHLRSWNVDLTSEWLKSIDRKFAKYKFCLSDILRLVRDTESFAERRRIATDFIPNFADRSRITIALKELLQGSRPAVLNAVELEKKAHDIDGPLFNYSTVLLMTVEQTREFVKSLGEEFWPYAEVFSREKLDARSLVNLTDRILKEDFKISNRFHRITLIWNFQALWRGNERGPVSPEFKKEPEASPVGSSPSVSKGDHQVEEKKSGDRLSSDSEDVVMDTASEIPSAGLVNGNSSSSSPSVVNISSSSSLAAAKVSSCSSPSTANVSSSSAQTDEKFSPPEFDVPMLNRSFETFTVEEQNQILALVNQCITGQQPNIAAAFTMDSLRTGWGMMTFYLLKLAKGDDSPGTIVALLTSGKRSLSPVGIEVACICVKHGYEETVAADILLKASVDSLNASAIVLDTWPTNSVVCGLADRLGFRRLSGFYSEDDYDSWLRFVFKSNKHYFTPSLLKPDDLPIEQFTKIGYFVNEFLVPNQPNLDRKFTTLEIQEWEPLRWCLVRDHRDELMSLACLCKRDDEKATYEIVSLCEDPSVKNSEAQHLVIQTLSSYASVNLSPCRIFLDNLGHDRAQHSIAEQCGFKPLEGLVSEDGYDEWQRHIRVIQKKPSKPKNRSTTARKRIDSVASRKRKRIRR
eukprot:68436_1